MDRPDRPEPGACTDLPQDRALRFRIIHNARAGGKTKRRERLRAVLARLEAAGHSHEIVTTASAGDAAAFARETTRAMADVLVVAGGDGTVNDALQGIGPGTPPLGLIPLGTANVLAHEIGIGIDPARIAGCLMQGRIQPIHPGEVNGHRFMMMAGVGLDAQVVSDLRRSVKSRFGKAAYLIEVTRTLRRWRCEDICLSVDAAEHRAATLVVSRGKRYGGSFILAPRGDIAAPSFQITLFPTGRPLQVFARFVAIPLGLLHRLNLVQQVEARGLEIAGPVGDPVQADGDIVAHLPARIRLSPEPIYLCMPRLRP
ncbi:diacylglycerol/lipid kinase family protein [Pseudodonghicola flavimaris]|uniref:YegS/Rv2252/BmrU family lipid kinase n=1 Tax=Pseudodonghicola flavimaris TaxID=3050036 RepID=A0ABT7EY61_9RHOB|nr:YegS/Rv2252/BmrU family lipid kinase [Pseudodonghicola flavimaris]MDK3017293.1 YegS/Rv2252/BmrU family lipid kinase [Pseudodonghicola flavimaris]